MEFEEHEEQEEEMGMPVPPAYDSLSNSVCPKTGPTASGEGASTDRKTGRSIRYRECQKNQAVNIGGHAVDGCGEFMAAGEDGTIDALKCAACNCHRNFHRKEADGNNTGVLYYSPQFSPYYRAPPPPTGYFPLTEPRPLALPSASGGGGGGGYSREDEDASNPSSSGGVSGGLKKRSRTKFTPEQKEKMLGFAERIGWRIQKQDEASVEQFCAETGVRRHVLKVWMHNNKHTLDSKF
ncbi:zinc-finger homeodomain protein 2-like isoform X2 [Mangifera indica]|uniref:zinc-finger homeodomain protein 2-like isoform X2 n=1 Tax=Mangifera indica TaxID=29780 RepID=UPI001CFB6383|nr:zinc-finger homeodomain protein 2-like isoform X2 [Mangifera indica]